MACCEPLARLHEVVALNDVTFLIHSTHNVNTLHTVYLMMIVNCIVKEIYSFLI